MPWMGLDLREFELCVVRIHAFNFLTSWGAQNLKNGCYVNVTRMLQGIQFCIRSKNDQQNESDILTLFYVQQQPLYKHIYGMQLNQRIQGPYSLPVIRGFTNQIRTRGRSTNEFTSNPAC